MTSRLPHCHGHPPAWVENARQELREIHILQQELLSLCYDEQTSAVPRASTCLGGKSRSRTPGKQRFSNKNSSPSAMTSRLPHCHGHPPAWVENPGQELRETQVLQQELLSLCYDQQTSALPQASTCLGGKSRSTTPGKHRFSNKNSSPSAMTSRLPHCHGHPPARVENPRQELRETQVLQQELLSLCYDEQTSALPRASTCLGGKSTSRTQGNTGSPTRTPLPLL